MLANRDTSRLKLWCRSFDVTAARCLKDSRSKKEINRIYYLRTHRTHSSAEKLRTEACTPVQRTSPKSRKPFSVAPDLFTSNTGLLSHAWRQNCLRANGDLLSGLRNPLSHTEIRHVAPCFPTRTLSGDLFLREVWGSLRAKGHSK